jgi:outer membrane protein assembly factor BamB
LNANSRALALDKVSGDLVWAIDDARQQSSGIDQDALASVVVADIGGFRCALYAMPTDLRVVDVKMGKILWSFTHALDGSRRDLVVSGGRIFDPDHSVLLEVTEDQVKTLWTSKDSFGAMSSPVLLDGYLYGTQSSDDILLPSGWANFQSGSLPLICMEWSTGRTLWRKDLPYVSATAAGGKLLLLELNGTLHIAEVTPSGYTELSSADVLGGAKKARTFATPPVLCGGRIYCRNYTGDLVCIDVSR